MKFIRTGLLFAIVLISCEFVFGQALFQDATSTAGLSDYIASTGDGHAPGAIFTGVNNDGYADLYVVQSSGYPNLLYLNTDSNGQRVFTEAVNNAGAGDLGHATGAIAGDYDSDTDMDIFITNFDGNNALYKSQLVETGTLDFVDITVNTDPMPGVQGQSIWAGHRHMGGCDIG